MNKGKNKNRARALAALAAAFSGNVFSLGAIVHLQGEKGDREAFYADVRVILDRTPMDQILGPVAVYEMDVTAVYESASKPEWVTMRMQFECPSPFVDSKGNVQEAARIAPGAPVKFRIGPGSYLVRRADLQSEPTPESAWNTSSAPMLMKAGRIACNRDAFEQALRSSMNTKTKTFDHAGFGQKIAKLGLPADLVLIGQALSNEFLDFSWSALWWETTLAGKRPDPSGKWSTLASKADKEAANAKMEALRKQYEPELKAARESLEKGIADMDAEFEFQQRAVELRKDRKLNKFEYQLIHTWVGKPESAVVEAMGNPALNEAGGRRFLQYQRVFDNTAQVVDMKTGERWEEGNYSECNVEFVTARDGKGAWRVADTRVWVRENALGSGAAWCYGFLRAPD